MEKKIIIISDKEGQYCKSLELLDQYVDVYVAQGVQDGLFHLASLPYHLIVIYTQQEPVFVCQLVETIRNMVLIPIMVLLPKIESARERIIKAGADAVLGRVCGEEEIRLQAYALIRRYITWESKEAEGEDSIVVGSLNLNIFKRVMYWNQIQINLVKREFDLLYLLAATPGRVYTYSQIYQSVWKEYPQDDVKNMVYCLVHRLKKKLRKIDVKACDIICSVKQVGYCLKVNNE